MGPQAVVASGIPSGVKVVGEPQCGSIKMKPCQVCQGLDDEGFFSSAKDS
jgi:hypothetical protein